MPLVYMTLFVLLCICVYFTIRRIVRIYKLLQSRRKLAEPVVNRAVRFFLKKMSVAHAVIDDCPTLITDSRWTSNRQL
jgi:hypothetical protein